MSNELDGQTRSTYNSNRIGKLTSRRSVLLAASLTGASLGIPAAARAEGTDALSDTSGLTADELAVVNATAQGFEQVDTKGGVVVEDGSFQPFDFDKLFAALDEGASDQKALTQAAVATPQSAAVAMKWNTDHFVKCLAKKIGIADVKQIIKAFAEPKVRKALKSKQYKKASSIAFNILKKTSPKIAKFLIKKAARSVLPGGAVGMLAMAAGQCALGEL